MAVSKVIYKSSPSATPETWIDATTATATASDIISPKTAMLADGEMTTGTGNFVTLQKLAGPSGYLSYRWAQGVFDENEEFDVNVSSIIGKHAGVSVPASCQASFYNAKNLKSITLRGYLNPQYTGQGNYAKPNFTDFASKDSYFGKGANVLESVTIITDNEFPIMPSTTVSAFAGRTELKYINIVFDMSGISNYNNGYNFRNMFQNCSSLEEVRFAPNSLLWMSTSYQLFNVSQNLSDDSLVSIANALAVGSSAPNLKLLSTPYARCSTLMGTVADGLFTQSDNGTVSLADFIANTKGWTLST